MRYKTGRIGIHILAFLTARCSLFGMYPFVVPFFMAAYLQEKSSVSVFVCLMLGMLSQMAGMEIIRYALVLLCLLVMLQKTDRKEIFSSNGQIALAAGMILWAVSMPYRYLVTGRESILLDTLLEGCIATCATLIFEQGFVALRVGTNRMFAENERFIGMFAMLTVALFGCPAVTTPVSLLFIICSYLTLYHTCRFDGSIGIAMGSMTGLVLAFKEQEVAYLAVMILLTSLVVVMKEIGKAGVLLAYVGGTLLLGAIYEPKLLSAPMLGSMLIAALLYLFTPGKWLRRTLQPRKEMTSRSQDLLIQQATRERIESFGQAFLAMEKMLNLHEMEWEQQIPNGLSNMYLSGDGISLLNAVESQSSRLADLRRNFIRQLGQVGEIITGFQSDISEQSYRLERFEVRVAERFGNMGVTVTKAVSLKDNESRIRVYVSCFARRREAVTGKMLAKRMSQIVGEPMICLNREEDIVGKEESSFTFVEEGHFYLTTGVVRRNRNGETQCGDSFSVKKLDAGKAVCMLSDGMGSGEHAYVKSRQVVDLLEQLLEAGFGRELAIELINSFVSFLADGNASSTLDLTMVDLHTGVADFVKLGASTTFIRHSSSVECIHSTSLPVGVLEQVELDTCERTLEDGDIIVMVSDGVLDGIPFENKETYLAERITQMESDNVQMLAERLMAEVESMQQGNLRDDSTVLTVGVWERRN